MHLIPENWGAGRRGYGLETIQIVVKNERKRRFHRFDETIFGLERDRKAWKFARISMTVHACKSNDAREAIRVFHESERSLMR